MEIGNITIVFSLFFIGGCLASILPNGGAWMLGGGVICGVIIPWLWWKQSKFWLWLIAGLVACLASFYVQFRTPQPQANDISKFAPASRITVQGEVMESPMITSSGRGKFTLLVKEVQTDSSNSESVSGKLYTTISLTQATGLRPGQLVKVIGSLYKPSPPDHSGDFNFRLYLARLGIFAGFSGQNLQLISDRPTFGDWWVRSRMIRAHVTGAGMPEGALLSSLVLGNRAIDLPDELKSTFIEVGLAAALAASGFQVSIILGAVLALNRHSSKQVLFVEGIICLLGFLLLTGISPSVLRAVVMGIGSLVGIVVDRRTRPLNGLLLAAVILLLINPLWIWDLGFQFSFLATLGLMVSADAIAKRLDWLPPLFASLLSIPIAAYIWTLPLQLYAFGKISPYSILANVLTTPLISLGTIAGIISGLLGVIYVPLGAVFSWFMLSPLALTIGIANWVHSLPGATSSAGAISVGQLWLGYGIICLIWLNPWVQKRWLPALAIALIILFIPNTINRASLFQATLISAERSPVMLIQNQGQVILINSGDSKIAKFTLLPLFQKLGINQIDWGIATNSQLDTNGGWASISKQPLLVSNFREISDSTSSAEYRNITKAMTNSGTKMAALSLNSPLAIAPQIQIELLNQEPLVLRLKTADTSWLLVVNSDQRSQKLLLDQPAILANLKAQVLWWTGDELLPEFLEAVQPKTAIASTAIIESDITRQLQSAGINLFWMNRDGAIQWKQTGEIKAMREDVNLPL